MCRRVHFVIEVGVRTNVSFLPFWEVRVASAYDKGRGSPAGSIQRGLCLDVVLVNRIKLTQTYGKVNTG